MNHSQRHFITALIYPFLFLAAMWAVFGFEKLEDYPMLGYGIYPRAIEGLTGIVTAPFVHGDWNHLINNSYPILVLGSAIWYFYRSVAVRVILLSWFITGFWVWVGARPAWHIGASGLIYAWVSFLFVSGVIRGHKRLMTLSLLLIFIYGSMVWGVLPIDYKISWESHLFGAIAGVVLAWYFRHQGLRKPNVKWEEEDLAALESKFGPDYWDPEKAVFNERSSYRINYEYKPKDKDLPH